MDIRSLKDTSKSAIFAAFEKAFAEYEVQVNRYQFETMIKRRGFCPELSFAAFEGDEILSFTLNGVGQYNGLFTAYDTGTGTIAEHRGKGLSKRIFEYSLPLLRQAGVKQYLLEVLQHNNVAVELYRSSGFEVIREFNYFVGEWDNLKLEGTNGGCQIKEGSLEQCFNHSSFMDFSPSWQNSMESVMRESENFIGVIAYIETEVVGFVIFEPSSGDITQLAVNVKYRREGVATSLLRYISKKSATRTFKMVNTHASCSSINEFWKSLGVNITGSQFEMVKSI